MKKILLSVLSVFVAISLSYAKVIVVDVAGGGQYTTIKEAVAAAVANDSILVMSGDYFFDASHGKVTVSKKLFIIGSGYTTAENGGTRLVDVPGNGLFDLDGASDGTHISGFRIDSKGTAVNIQANAQKIVIENNFFIQRSGSYCINLTSSSSDTIRSNILVAGDQHHQTAYGIQLNSTSGDLICNNIFSWFSYAIYENTSASGTSTIRNNIILDSGFSYYGYSSVYLYSNCLFYSNIFMNADRGVSDQSSGKATIAYNGFFNNLSDGSTGLNPNTADPMFENYSSSDNFNENSLETSELDFHLKDASTYIDGGVVGPAYLDVDGSRNDIGLYGGSYPFNNDLGIPTIPEVITISVSPTSVSPSGSITISATGRIGGGGAAKAAKAIVPPIVEPNKANEPIIQPTTGNKNQNPAQKTQVKKAADTKAK
ncbi:MAG: right-handed parallel beta-helix repeat-containing protein [Candidatus Neomarinimicrobiota bacterium]